MNLSHGGRDAWPSFEFLGYIASCHTEFARFGSIDYEELAAWRAHKPKLIVNGPAYPRADRVRKNRESSKKRALMMMVDIAHIAGLVAAGEHPSPVQHAGRDEHHAQDPSRPTKRWSP
jgi:glycine hydroxymethyltransferase